MGEDGDELVPLESRRHANEGRLGQRLGKHRRLKASREGVMKQRRRCIGAIQKSKHRGRKSKLGSDVGIARRHPLLRKPLAFFLQGVGLATNERRVRAGLVSRQQIFQQ